MPPERVHLLNPGQRLSVGDRDLLAVRPPTFDAPETTGVFDTRSRALFTADCFGALLAEPAERVRDLLAAELLEADLGGHRLRPLEPRGAHRDGGMDRVTAAREQVEQHE